MPDRRFCNNCFACGIFIVINFLSHAFIVASMNGRLPYCGRVARYEKSSRFAACSTNLLTTPELHLLYFVFRIEFVAAYRAADDKVFNTQRVPHFAIDHEFRVVQ